MISNRLLFLITLFSLSSCSGLYKPAMVNSPMLEKKGDGHLAVNVGSGLNIQGSYSPLNNIVLIGNLHRNNSLSTAGIPSGIRQYEIGIGIYETKLNEDKYIDFIAGYGSGNLMGSTIYEPFGNLNVDINSNFRNFFIQTSIGSDITKDFVFAAGGKLNILQFYDIIAPPTFVSLVNPSFFDGTSRVLLQPFFTLRYTPGFIGFNSYFGFSFADQSGFFSYRALDFNLGIFIDINKLKNHAKK